MEKTKIHPTTKISYDVEAWFSLFLLRYPDIDPVYLKEYLSFCFATNIFGSFVTKVPRHQHSPHRYHHLFPRCLFPELSKSSTNLVCLTTKDHYDAHCLLAFAFRSYYHSSDKRRSHLFSALSCAVGATLGQLSSRQLRANRAWYSDEFKKLTGKSLNLDDPRAQWRDYQSMRRSTNDGKAYDNLKGFLRYICHKYQINYPVSSGIPERTHYVLATSGKQLTRQEVLKLRSYLAAYLEAANSNSSSTAIIDHLVV